MHESGTTFLDCTLRDGGYHNQWRFEKAMAVDLVAALNRCGIDIIEVGFKTPVRASSRGNEGLFRYCDESELRFLRDYPESSYAFMINTAEFLVSNRPDQLLLESCILPARDSLFEWARIATHYQTFAQSLDQAGMLKNMGYRVALNLMGVSLLDMDQIRNALSHIPDTVDVLYFADSFGNLGDDDIRAYIDTFRENFSGQIGLHAHDNMGLAFSNTLTALRCGIDFVDSTVAGMGRGAGNLRTEQLMLALYKQSRRFKPAELLAVIEKWMVPLRTRYQWGWDYAYMLGAIEAVHPVYCQNLRSTNRFSTEEVSCILSSIEPEKRESFDPVYLSQTIGDLGTGATR